MGSVDQTASVMVRVPRGLESPPGSAYLLVVENDSSRIVHLPRSGEIIIGRTSEAAIQLDHPSVSRRHATIRIAADDGTMRIADLDSHNKTYVNGVLVQESRTLSSGDVIKTGDITLVVHVSNPPLISRAAHGEVSWRRRLVEEIDRAITYQRSLAVIALTGVDPGSLTGLTEGLRLIDVLGEGTDGQTLLLLPEVGRDQARAIAQRTLDVVRTDAPNACAGLAMCPTDATDTDTILLAARTAAKRAAKEKLAFADAADAAAYIELGTKRVLVVDPAMQRVFALLEKLAPTPIPVLIIGETGVGKENAAYAVHHWSKRTAFVPVNCAELTESLADAQLFGYDKGAYTGATVAKPGFFESAEGGTLFFDEIGEIPLAMQAKLLRVLQEKKIRRLGENKERDVDVRIVAATNRDLDAMVKAGTFREDLKQRLGKQVVLPPLRDRKSEIPLLAREFLAAACTGNAPKTITPAAMQLLLAYHWPGNVRELQNEMTIVSAIAPDDHIEPSDLPENLGGATQTAAPTTGPIEALPLDPPSTFRPIADEVRELERRRMAEALVAANGVKTRAAQLIDMPIRTFTLKLKQYRL